MFLSTGGDPRSTGTVFEFLTGRGAIVLSRLSRTPSKVRNVGNGKITYLTFQGWPCKGPSLSLFNLHVPSVMSMAGTHVKGHSQAFRRERFLHVFKIVTVKSSNCHNRVMSVLPIIDFSRPFSSSFSISSSGPSGSLFNGLSSPVPSPPSLLVSWPGGQGN
jgi:hypothetical protein